MGVAVVWVHASPGWQGALLSSQARVGVTDEGIILKKSPLLIEPDSKKAGFSLL